MLRMLLCGVQASVVAALSRDNIFCRVAPGKYALQAIVNQHAYAPVDSLLESGALLDFTFANFACQV